MASTAEQSPAKKRGAKKAGDAKKTAAGDAGKKKKTGRAKKPQYTSYSGYIRKVLKQVHPETGINTKTMRIMDSFCKGLYDKLVTEAGSLLKHSKRGTLSDHDIQSAVKLVLPGELAKHAASEGAKAVTTYKATIVRKEKKPKKKAEAAADETAEQTVE
ncbi:Histone H2B [Aphelenchoides bicaudatus]|nr:Histone H2B [Aphelenchoides bicaudatus]